jgi:hypothetical protein
MGVAIFLTANLSFNCYCSQPDEATTTATTTTTAEIVTEI